MSYKKVEDWIPSDNLTLEDIALTAVKSDYNTLIVAGPGAGKTELLAQRACYLLETNTCLYPQKILAISFKRDAAFNLRERVKKRCGEILAQRFESLTFDAFAKLILDRLYRGLPEGFKITSEYDVLIGEKDILEIYKRIDINFSNTHSEEEILTFHNSRLPFEVKGVEESIRWKVWRHLLNSNSIQLSFKMIMRLAQLILNANPKIKKYLQSTYSHIFLDEFQDTTFLQFDFLNSCFESSEAILTAVGDDKQRIMLWAGAQPDIFKVYVKGYNAKELALTMNFRSAPKLVALQNHLILKLLDKKDFARPSENWTKSEGESFVWIYDDPEKETKHLFESVRKWITEEKINPRDICILVKQQLSTYAGNLIDYFNANGVKTRDENQLQDLLSEDVILFVINVLTLISKNKAIVEKTDAITFLTKLSSTYEDKQLLSLERNFNSLITRLKKKVIIEGAKLSINKLVQEIIDFANRDRIKANYPNYKNPKFFNDLLEQMNIELARNLVETNDLNEAVNLLLGKESIPVMTIHKSKGLEYHSIIFIGLEDGAFWSFEKQPDEDKCAFFVALSRAKERVVFTYSKTRNNKWGTLKNQSFDKIKIIFDELEKSELVKFEQINI